MKTTRRKAQGVKSIKNKEVTFTQLEEELGFSRVNRIFGFSDYTRKDAEARNLINTNAKYFFGHLLFTLKGEDRKFFIEQLKFYMKALDNGTSISWVDVLEKFWRVMNGVLLVEFNEVKEELDRPVLNMRIE